MGADFLLALKARLLADLADLRLDWRGPAVEGEEEPARAVQIFIGDLPPKKRRPALADKKEASAGKPPPEKIDDYFPCIVLVPTSGQEDQGEDVVSVGVIYGVYCAADGDAEGAEIDHWVLRSRIKQSLFPCRKQALDDRYKLVKDEKGRLFPWEKSDLQARPYIQATLMTCWRMKGLE